jgi:hypothetical protein
VEDVGSAIRNMPTRMANAIRFDERNARLLIKLVGVPNALSVLHIHIHGELPVWMQFVHVCDGQVKVTGSELTMVSTPYTRGRSHEYQVLRKLREEGWLCSRSAASHGPVDIFAGKDGLILLVQVKSGKGRATKVEKEILKFWGKAFKGRVEIWKFRKGRPLEREIVYENET